MRAVARVRQPREDVLQNGAGHVEGCGSLNAGKARCAVVFAVAVAAAVKQQIDTGRSLLPAGVLPADPRMDPLQPPPSAHQPRQTDDAAATSPVQDVPWLRSGHGPVSKCTGHCR